MSALAGLQSFGRNLLRNSRQCLKHVNFICQLQKPEVSADATFYKSLCTLFLFYPALKKTLWARLRAFNPKTRKRGRLAKQKVCKNHSRVSVDPRGSENVGGAMQRSNMEKLNSEYVRWLNSPLKLFAFQPCFIITSGCCVRNITDLFLFKNYCYCYE